MFKLPTKPVPYISGGVSFRAQCQVEDSDVMLVTRFRQGAQQLTTDAAIECLRGSRAEALRPIPKP